MSDPNFREVDKGPTFEIHQGTMGVQRIDWTRSGAVRAIINGYATVDMAEVINRRRDALVRTKLRITMLYDLWDVTSYDSAIRLELTKWGQAHKEDEDMVHFLTRSKLTNMAVSVVSLAVPGMVLSHQKRADFDIVAKKLGLPFNPPMPPVPAPPPI